MMKDIANYEGLYSVDQHGNVWSIKRDAVLKPRIRKNGYAAVALSKNGVVKDFFIHRLVAQAYIGNVVGLDVNHIDGDRENNKFDNLEIVDRSKNLLHGMHVLRSKNAKLTHEQVVNVKQLVKNGVAQADIARDLCVSKQIINQIVRNKTYSNSCIANEYPKG